ncbi:MAG: hypothetical protein WD750_07575 [Gammaproteobacteria bacterium]
MVDLAKIAKESWIFTLCDLCALGENLLKTTPESRVRFYARQAQKIPSYQGVGGHGEEYITHRFC